LRVIALGLRGLQIEKSAKEIINNLSRLQVEILKVREAFDTLGSHLDNAKKKYEETDKWLAHFEDKLENISEKSIKEGEQKLLN
jgi:DNA anti-recombination protein RmuC